VRGTSSFAVSCSSRRSRASCDLAHATALPLRRRPTARAERASAEGSNSCGVPLWQRWCSWPQGADHGTTMQVRIAAASFIKQRLQHTAHTGHLGKMAQIFREVNSRLPRPSSGKETPPASFSTLLCTAAHAAVVCRPILHVQLRSLRIGGAGRVGVRQQALQNELCVKWLVHELKARCAVPTPVWRLRDCRCCG